MAAYRYQWRNGVMALWRQWRSQRKRVAERKWRLKAAAIEPAESWRGEHQPAIGWPGGWRYRGGWLKERKKMA